MLCCMQVILGYNQKRYYNLSCTVIPDRICYLADAGFILLSDVVARLMLLG